jgi:hypothetical protein
MAVYQQFLGRFYVGTTLDNFYLDDGVNAQTVTLSSGHRYITGYAGEGTNQLCEDWTAKVQALGGNYAGATATYSPTTGLITLDFNSHVVDILWMAPALQTLLGFTGVQSGADCYVATYSPRYVWRPSRGLADYPTNLSTIWNPISTTMGYRSSNGTPFTIPGSVINEAILRYQFLREAETLTPAIPLYQDLQQFWLDVFHAGAPLRFYPDRLLNSITAFKECLWGAEQVGSFRDYISRYADKYNGLWSVEIPLWEYK